MISSHITMRPSLMLWGLKLPWSYWIRKKLCLMESLPGEALHIFSCNYIFSRDTQAQCWPDAAEGIWQSTGAAPTDEAEGKHFVACLFRWSANTLSGNPSTMAGSKTYMEQTFGQYVLTDLSFPAFSFHSLWGACADQHTDISLFNPQFQ